MTKLISFHDKAMKVLAFASITYFLLRFIFTIL